MLSLQGRVAELERRKDAAVAAASSQLQAEIKAALPSERWTLVAGWIAESRAASATEAAAAAQAAAAAATNATTTSVSARAAAAVASRAAAAAAAAALASDPTATASSIGAPAAEDDSRPELLLCALSAGGAPSGVGLQPRPSSRGPMSRSVPSRSPLLAPTKSPKMTGFAALHAIHANGGVTPRAVTARANGADARQRQVEQRRAAATPASDAGAARPPTPAALESPAGPSPAPRPMAADGVAAHATDASVSPTSITADLATVTTSAISPAAPDALVAPLPGKPTAAPAAPAAHAATAAPTADDDLACALGMFALAGGGAAPTQMAL